MAVHRIGSQQCFLKGYKYCLSLTSSYSCKAQKKEMNGGRGNGFHWFSQF